MRSGRGKEDVARREKWKDSEKKKEQTVWEGMEKGGEQVWRIRGESKKGLKKVQREGQ